MFIFWCDDREEFCVVDTDRFEVRWINYNLAMAIIDPTIELHVAQQNPNQLFLM